MAANKVYRLHNQIKHYEWGSHVIMPEFLGIENSAKVPYAEMWMGTHVGAPSSAEGIPLKQIAGELPFLFKLLAVEKPLSIQAHPNKEDAIDGFRMEEESGVDIKSPMRNYKDKNHKPEILCALTPFSFMAGFRSIENLKECLDEFLQVFPQLKEIIIPLVRSLKTDSLAVFFRILFNLSKLEIEYIGELIKNFEIPKKGNVIKPEQWNLMRNFAVQYPEDPAILSPLYLNLLTIEPLQAVYIPPGVLHSYISGFGVELMTASDNVLRGGLTPKYIDIPELMNILTFKPYIPRIYIPLSASWSCYNGGDFSLAIMKGSGAKEVFPEKGPAICLVADGELFTQEASFKKGESFFIPQSNENYEFSGNFSAFFAASAASASVLRIDSAVN